MRGTYGVPESGYEVPAPAVRRRGHARSGHRGRMRRLVRQPGGQVVGEHGPVPTGHGVHGPRPRQRGPPDGRPLRGDKGTDGRPVDDRSVVPGGGPEDRRRSPLGPLRHDRNPPTPGLMPRGTGPVTPARLRPPSSGAASFISATRLTSNARFSVAASLVGPNQPNQPDLPG